MTTGLSVHGMEQEQITSLRPDNVTAVSDTQTMLNYLWQIPQELRHAIFLLFLESSLSYNFTCFQVLEGRTGIVFSVACSPDGKTVLTGSADTKAHLWYLEGAIISTFQGHTEPITLVLFSPNGKTVLTGSSDNTARLWDLKGNLIRTFQGHSKPMTSVTVSPDGKAILTGSNETRVGLWSLDGNV